MIKYICTAKEYPTKESGTLKVISQTGEEIFVKYLCDNENCQFCFDDKYKNTFDKSDLNFMIDYIVDVIYKQLDKNKNNKLYDKGVE